MKKCPRCGRVYTDNSTAFCLDDGTPLVTAPDSSFPGMAPPPTLPNYSPQQFQGQQPQQTGKSSCLPFVIGGVVLLLLVGLLGGGTLIYLASKNSNNDDGKDYGRNTQYNSPGNGNRNSNTSVRSSPTKVVTTASPAANSKKSTLTYKNGGRYEGDVVNGKAEGYGVLTFPSGERYEGEFENDMQEGRGKTTFPTGNRYEGEFSKGTFEGKGVFYFADGERYEGGFTNGKRSGYGIYYYKNGTQDEGTWKEDKLVSKTNGTATNSSKK